MFCVKLISVKRKEIGRKKERERKRYRGGEREKDRVYMSFVSLPVDHGVLRNLLQITRRQSQFRLNRID